MERRDFIKRGIAFLVSLPVFYTLYRYLSPDADADSVLITANRGDVPEGGALMFPDKQVAILREKGEIRAVSLTCTHLGCTVALSGDRFVCPCHGSIFTLNGDVLKGPAQRPLDEYPVTEKDGEIRIGKRVKA
ncbi:ubiquinol-cytochrome c reductase iron-sulfur subunit [Limisalsivibrio acetivorans]|uniref:QcrA and Rieske domain-containing protein n=1 Tax=Limisalsivibrio acetivorans TaxID=1304888 RepID=UPI0003B49C36|nr:Rieske (2Fe-2S) protein [Limisalsivibrio acetivorans]